MKQLILLVLLFAAISSCKKTEDVIVRDNIPPPDRTIDSSTIEVYIDKVYIHLLGREASLNERSNARIILRQDNFSVSKRKEFLDVVFTQPEYRRNLYTVANNEYLNNLDSNDITQQINVFNLLLTQPQYAPFFDLINAEVLRLQQLKAIVNDLESGALNYKGMLRCCVNNYFYDQINMGTENFVVSTFQHFFFRYPSDAELLSGKTMVDGLNAVLFLQIGKSKDDYLNIFFNTDDYYEGQVRNAFQKYVFREPTSAEIAFYAAFYKTGNDYRQLQKEVLSLDEYAGVR